MQDVTPPLTVIEKHLAKEEQAQTNAAAVKECRGQAERDRRAVQQQRMSHSTSLTEQTAGAAAVASDSHHATLSRQHKQLSADHTAGPSADQAADAGHFTGPSTPVATAKLHSLCISPPEGPQESQAVHTAAPCKLFCCPLTKVGHAWSKDIMRIHSDSSYAVKHLPCSRTASMAVKGHHVVCIVLFISLLSSVLCRVQCTHTSMIELHCYARQSVC